MSATIDLRGRISGTRITVYDVLTYSDAGWQNSSIAATLGISSAQVQAALNYVAENREKVMENYRAILARIKRGNPPEIEARRQRSHDLLVEKLQQIEHCRNGK
jgi:uncharacterized protein (DUF433 family)